MLELIVDGSNLWLEYISCIVNGLVKISHLPISTQNFRGFESAIRQIRTDVYTSVLSTAQIDFPFTVRSHILSINNIGYSNDRSKLM